MGSHLLKCHHRNVQLSLLFVFWKLNSLKKIIDCQDTLHKFALVTDEAFLSQLHLQDLTITFISRNEGYLTLILRNTYNVRSKNTLERKGLYKVYDSEKNEHGKLENQVHLQHFFSSEEISQGFYAIKITNIEVNVYPISHVYHALPHLIRANMNIHTQQASENASQEII